MIKNQESAFSSPPPVLGRVRASRPVAGGRDCTASEGFSLLEILVVLSLLGIAALFALPAFQVLGRRARIEGISRAIQVELVAARQQAIKRSQDTGLEISAGTSPAACRRFIDQNRSGTLDVGEPVLGIVELGTVRKGVSVKIDNLDDSTPSSAPAVHAMVFAGFGSANPASTLKSVYIGDGFGNLVQISIPNAISGKVETTKWNGNAFTPTPWTWQ
jgi:prepilin-type N-terminal cleavage/methylation domain-containing protein